MSLKDVLSYCSHISGFNPFKGLSLGRYNSANMRLAIGVD